MDKIAHLIRRLMYFIMAMIGLLLFLLLAIITYQPLPQHTNSNTANSIEEWNAELMVTENPNVPTRVKEGYLLVSSTSYYMGPLAEDPKDRFAGNNLSCTNCHLNGGTLSGSASWIGITKRFPQFGGRANKIGTLEERINGCMERSMNGKKIPEKDPKMKAIVAYMDWLGEELPKVNTEDFAGYPSIVIPNTEVDLGLGKEIYLRECTVCHGEEGKGIRYASPKKGYQYPPLWGEDSYNNGAGMHRVITAAAFIKNNMPYLQSRWDKPKLTDEEAFHVAGYINHFSRPIKLNTDLDYPDKKLKPVSTPYGPWEDHFSAEEHQFGPFPPIIEFYKTTYNLKKTK